MKVLYFLNLISSYTPICKYCNKRKNNPSGLKLTENANNGILFKLLEFQSHRAKMSLPTPFELLICIYVNKDEEGRWK